MEKSRQILQHITSLIFSLLLAFFFWATATEVENPTQQRSYKDYLPLVIEGVPDGMTAYNGEDTRVSVVLRAPQTVWNSLKTEEIRAFVDLSEAEAGKVTVPIQVEVNREPVQVVEINPKEVTLNLEEIQEKDITVNVKVLGTPMLGYEAETRNPVVAPRIVKVRGPASVISEVKEVRATVQLDGEQRDVQGDYDALPLDEAGKELSYLEVNPKQVTVGIRIQALSGYRDLAVKAKLVGQPTAGYRITNVTVKPNVVSVVGRASAVQSAPGYIETELINLEEATESLTITAFLQMPEGVSIIVPPAPKVTVSIGIEAIETGITLDREPKIQGLEPGLTVTVEPTSTVVILSGPIGLMDALDPDEIEVILDLTELTVGQFTLTPRIITPEGIRAESILPESITVILERLRP
ncbi:MAG: hypothetical protein JW981_00060 [Anaerolineae bacterium]|nr:hypothetical protein [Anaerolineae bacterium]